MVSQTRTGKMQSDRRRFESDKELVRLMKDMYNLGPDVVELQNKVNGKKMAKREVNKEITANEKAINLRTRKKRVLDNIIFPSMVNLTAFLEYMAKSPYIQIKFEKDLEHLFFSTSPEVDKHGRSNAHWIFERFIEAATRLGKNKDEVKDSLLLQLPDWGLVLCDIMQSAVYQALLEMGPHKFRNPISATKILMTDIERASVWTQEISYEQYKKLRSQNENKKNKRPALFLG
jgi:hypothetical protein